MSLLLILISVGSLTGKDDGGAGSDFSVVTISFCLIWVLFFVASAMTLVAQLPKFKARDNASVEALDAQLVNVSAQLSMQEADKRSHRQRVLSSLSWYDTNALNHSLKVLGEDLLADSKASGRRVRFSFLASSTGETAARLPVALGSKIDGKATSNLEKTTTCVNLADDDETVGRGKSFDV